MDQPCVAGKVFSLFSLLSVWNCLDLVSWSQACREEAGVGF